MLDEHKDKIEDKLNKMSNSMKHLHLKMINSKRNASMSEVPITRPNIRKLRQDQI